ncbi:hypothetical protein Slala03_82000 [Streptomyces lavendulae subsp. lavendulae]|uniref:DUF6461 domain-containing protein n=1 Tax=Streptomyces lavendulae TaxID=1914 RepID=UPI0024A203FA|nr:hypothetical protein [Streptomyces lavendulae]GLV88511.1 hypothetical protein Slala03_82000 [Streptomyces lavendulae subsp. lavendulae]
MTDGTTWLAAPQSIAFGGYHVVLARGLTPSELADRLAENVDDMRCIAVAVGEHTGESLEELLDDTFGDPSDGIALRLGRAGDWVFAVAYGGWPGEFGSVEPVSRGGVHACLLEYEEENGKPVPPMFEYAHDGRLLSACNLHLDASWGYQGVAGDPETAARLQNLLTNAGLPNPDLERRDVHRTALGVIERFLGISLPKALIVEGTLPAVLLEPA